MFCDFFYKFNKWLEEKWIFFLFLLIMLLIFIIVIYWIYRIIYFYRINKKFKKNNIENEELFKMELNFLFDSLNFKIISIKYIKNGPNKTLAWKALIEILTKVIANTFDEHGSEKAVLDSLYNIFTNLRIEMKENIGAFSTTKILLTFLNKTLRPFLAKWDKLINKQKVFETKNLNDNSLNYKNDFEIDYDYLKNEIKNKQYIQSLAHLCGFRLKIEKYVNK